METSNSNLTKMKKTMISAFVACTTLCGCNNANTTVNEQSANIVGEWSIVEAMGKSTDSTETAPFIHFTDSGTVSGHASVNTFFGQYTQSGDSIFLEQVGITSMMGHDMDTEMAVTSALAQWVTLEAEDSMLYAKDKDGQVVMTMKRN